MNSSLLNYNRYEEKQLLNDILNRPQTKQLFKKIDADNTLVGAGIIYIDRHYTTVRLREFKPVCRIKPIHIIIHEVPPAENINEYTVKLRNNSRPSKVMAESASALLSCSSAVLGWLVVAGSVGAAPLTAGTSSLITVIAVTGASATTVQCANSLLRTRNEVLAPESNDFLDSQEWYQETSKALDWISLAGVAVAGLTTVKVVLNLKKASSRSLSQILKGMTRSERTRLSRELARVEVPGLSNKVFKKMVRAGVQPKRYNQTSINTALMLNLKNAVGATLSFGGSALSGNVKNFVVGVHEELN